MKWNTSYHNTINSCINNPFSQVEVSSVYKDIPITNSSEEVIDKYNSIWKDILSEKNQISSKCVNKWRTNHKGEGTINAKHVRLNQITIINFNRIHTSNRKEME